jgi:hypothetical protein
VKGQGSRKVIMVHDTPPYGHVPIPNIIDLSQKKQLFDLSKVSKRVFPYYIWILIIYCSFKKREVKLRKLWCLMPFLTILQLYHGYLVLLVEYTEKTTDLPQV